MIIIFYKLIDQIYEGEVEKPIRAGYIGADSAGCPRGFSSLSMSCTNAVIAAPKMAISPKNQRRPAISATEPTSGGTIRNPKQHTVETAPKADTLLTQAEPPAVANTI